MVAGGGGSGDWKVKEGGQRERKRGKLREKRESEGLKSDFSNYNFNRIFFVKAPIRAHFVSMNSFRRALCNVVCRIVKFLFGQKVNFSLINYSKGKIVFLHNKLLIKYEF